MIILDNKKKCLVLGGNGFLGKDLIRHLLDCGYSVRVFDRSNNGMKWESSVEWCEGDFLNTQDLENAMSGCDVIFHLITMSLPQSSNDNPVYDVQSNLVGTIKMLSIAVKCGIKQIVFPSSGGTVYGVPEKTPTSENQPTNPICSYGITKLAIEKYLHLFCQLYGLDYRILRISNPYGEGLRMDAPQGAIGVFIGKAMRQELIQIWGDGSVVRDYLYISDVSSAFVNAMNYSGKTRVFNIGSGVGTSLNQILDSIESKMGKLVKRSYIEPRGVDVPVSILDNTLSCSELSWNPKVNLDEGIGRVVNHYLYKEGK